MITITQEMLFNTLEMFISLGLKLTILFLSISYLVGVAQEYIPPSKIKNILSNKQGKGYIIAALLGSITPFCSCSTIPFLKGLLRAKAGFGPMMVFLFASPLLNPIIIVLFIATFGINVTALYFIIALSISIIAGYALEKLGFEKYIKPEAYSEFEVKQSSTTECECDTIIQNKWKRIWNTTWNDFKQIFPYLLAGIAVGSIVYGFIPTEFIANVASKNNPFAIPIAAIIGIPLYIRAEAVIPISAVLITKGMGLGAIMALIIGSAGASITEIILLKSLFKNTLIITFLFVIIGMAIFTGFLYHYLF